MKRLSTLFPLIIVALLAAASFWLEYVVRNETRSGYGKNRHDPDAIVENFTLERFNAEGSLSSRLEARKLTHYPDTDTAEIMKPQVSFPQKNGVTTTFHSESALADNRQSKITLIGKVKGERPASPSNLAQTLSADEMTVWTEEEIVRTHLPIRVTSGNSQLDAIGAEWNNLTGQLSLHSFVRATIQPGKTNP